MKNFRNKLKYKRDDASLQPRRTTDANNGGTSPAASVADGGPPNETPEAAALRLVRAFCMSDATTDAGADAEAEVALLPSIVETAESSPQAAADCARYIRKYMQRDYWSRPSYVYNAVMLMRILAENPGLTFTRNMDKKFVDAVRDLLRACDHPHVVHFVMETLQDFEAKGAVDEGVGRMVEMWHKELAKNSALYPPGATAGAQQPPPPPQGRGGFWQRAQPAVWAPQQQQQQQQQPPPVQQTTFASSASVTVPRAERRRSSSRLPKPRELQKRLDEAKTTAGVLADIVNTTAPAAALLEHDLADDLVARCRRASGQVLEFLDVRDPLPDNHEMAALLATHEVLQQTLHHYYSAVLDARKAINVGEARRAEDGSAAAGAGKGKAAAPLSPVGGGGGAAGVAGVAGGGGPSGGSNGSSARSSPREYGDTANDDDDEEDMIAAAIAASVAPGANARPARGGYGGGGGGGGVGGVGSAAEPENPFSDNLYDAHSRASSQHGRPSYGDGGGGSSSAAAGAAGAASSSAAAGPARRYADSDDDDDNDNESDDEYMRSQRRGKAPAVAVEQYAPPPGPPPSRPLVAELAGSSSAAAASGSGSGSGSGPAVDAEAGGKFPVYRY